MKQYTWFIEPLDYTTNVLVFNEVGDGNFSDNVLCADGQKHNLYKCPRKTVYSLCKSKTMLNLKFNIFIREGNGKIRQNKLLYQKAAKK